jgi:hypothetical protein
VWPFPTKELSVYLSSKNLVAWEILHRKGKTSQQELSAVKLQEMTASIHEHSQLTTAFKQYKTTLRLAPSLGRCYTLQAANKSLSQAELNGLADHWGRIFMGSHYAEWQWQAIQFKPEQAVLLCACQVKAQHLDVFQTVKPELIHLIDSLDNKDCAWVVSRDEKLVQSALVLNGAISTIRAWPSQYTSDTKAVIKKHLLLSDDIQSASIDYVVESRFGEVQKHGTP